MCGAWMVKKINFLLLEVPWALQGKWTLDLENHTLEFLGALLACMEVPNQSCV